MLSHIHHINFVVSDLSKRIDYFNRLLQQKPQIDTLQNRNVTTAKYNIGDTYLVLVQPLSNNGVVHQILEQRGEGIFLLSFATESIEQTIDKLELQNLEKRRGIDDWEICDIAGIDELGVILQLTESKTS